MPKVFIVGYDSLMEKMYLEEGWEVGNSIDSADLIQFTGGADVDPILYGEEPHPFTMVDVRRDVREKDIFNLMKSVPKAGVCRGGQFLNVMNGGRMYQHVDKHCSSHTVRVKKYGTVLCTSTHHQMMRPSDEGELIGYTDIAKLKECMRGGRKRAVEDNVDAEILWYSKTKSLCFQPHPEYGCDACKDLFFNLIKDKFNLKA